MVSVARFSNRVQMKPAMENSPETFKFEEILNFRDFNQCSKEKIVAKKFFRGGYLHKATPSDVKKLSELGIKTLIDMRSSEEARTVHNPHIDEVFKNDKNLLGKSTTRSHIPLWRVLSNFKLLVEQKKYSSLAYVPVYAIRRSSRDKLVQLFTSPLNEINLLGMYKLIIKYHSDEIKEILEHFTDEKNFPILIFCSLGKDRTGIMSAFISEIVGIPRDTTIREYAKSYDLISSKREDILMQSRRLYIGDWIIESPAEVMKEFLEFIDVQYGSVSSFLNSIGFGKEQQEKVRANLTKQQTKVGA
jgi:protein tyrosine/serine phosphatase